jgi:hypothetical protein
MVLVLTGGFIFAGFVIIALMTYGLWRSYRRK